MEIPRIQVGPTSKQLYCLSHISLPVS